MTVDLHVLYKETVLEHSRRPRNRRAIPGGHKSERNNPLCGDRITVYVQVKHDIVRDVSFEGSACAITIAVASLMTESVKDEAAAHADVTAERFRRILTMPGDGSFEDLGPLAALGGVRQFPMRVKCALLPWQALRAAVASACRT
jgi:nitrogen fixation NifU-like protein